MFQNIENRIIPLIFLMGIFIPTSMNGIITTKFVFIGCVILLSLLILLLSLQKNISIYALAIFILINSLLLIFTLTSPLSDFRFGTLLYFLILTIIFCLDFSKLKLRLETFRKTFQIVNFILIVFSFSILFEYTPITEFIRNWYSAFYDELLPNMLFNLKPVTVFGTHSIAGFYYFVFFLLNITTFYYMKKKAHFFISILYMLFLYNIQSSTSLVYFLICFAIILIIIYRKNKFTFFVTATTAIVIYLANYQDIEILQETSNKLFSDSNGILARYSGNGVLSNNIDFISNNPFNGLGFSYSNQFTYVDSGLVEYTLRGSAFSLILILIGLYLFIRRSLGKIISVFLFLLFLSFEVGFSNLIYFRSLFLIPFIVAYLHLLKNYNKIHAH